MKTRHKRKEPLSDSSTNESGSEVVVYLKKKRPQKRQTRKDKQTIKPSDTYDADSEASSANDIKREASEVLQGRLKMSSSSSADEYAFDDDNQTENRKPKSSKSQPTRSRTKPVDKHPTKSKTLHQRTSSAVVNSEFKVPEITNGPTPGLQPSLKRKSSVREKSSNLTPGGLLRVSFSDESFTDSNQRRLSMTDDHKEHRRSGRIETSTPAQLTATSKYTTKNLNNKLSDTRRPALPRLSDIASPILKDEQTSSSLKRSLEKTTTTPSDETAQSSGYGSMVKSSAALDGSYTAEPEIKKYKTEKEDTANKMYMHGNKKDRRKKAIAITKDREEKYLAELNELEDFDLCIE